MFCMPLLLSADIYNIINIHFIKAMLCMLRIQIYSLICCAYKNEDGNGIGTLHMFRIKMYVSSTLTS